MVFIWVSNIIPVRLDLSVLFLCVHMIVRQNLGYYFNFWTNEKQLAGVYFPALGTDFMKCTSKVGWDWPLKVLVMVFVLWLSFENQLPQVALLDFWLIIMAVYIRRTWNLHSA